MVKFRDHKPHEETFLTAKFDFTSSIDEISDWLNECNCDGGKPIQEPEYINHKNKHFNYLNKVSNGPKAVADGLKDALNLTWSEVSNKICILITDGYFQFHTIFNSYKLCQFF